MKARFVAGVALATALTAAVSTATARTSGPSRSAASKLTVWLQVDAQTGWPDLVSSTNEQFEKSHPGMSVDVQYQSWSDNLAKFDAALAAGNVPDVVELGNTQMTKYMAAGAFTDLTPNKSSFANARTWLKGLAASATYNGKVYGVPYYAGSRVVTYRSDLYKQVNAGVPKSLAQFMAVAKKLKAKTKKKGFSPVYIAGTDWYFAMSFVYDYGGQIAALRKGKWVGTLDSAKARAGLAAYKRFFLAASRGSKTGVEDRPQPYDVYAQGQAASIVGPAWFSGSVGKKLKPVTKQFVMPSHKAGQAMPGFLGGSDLAVPARSNDKAAARDWIRLFTSTESQRTLQRKGNIPNATNLLGNTVNERAAKRSWFVPTAKNWVNVENGNILRTMLARILTGKNTIKEATSAASDNITLTLNRP